MRPTKPEAILADALHRHRYPDHPVGCSCVWAPSDELEALEVYERLVENGAHVAYDLQLSESAPAGEPATAAKSIDDLSDRQWAVWWVVDFYGPLTDEELCERYPGQHIPPSLDLFTLPRQTPQSIRSRRAELVRAGHVRATGERRPTAAGGSAAVWAAVGSASEALAS